MSMLIDRNTEKQACTWQSRTPGVGLTLMILLLAGCGAGEQAAPVKVAGVALQGSMFGGQQPVIGATIQLYAAGKSGYGSAATPLITGAPVKTGAGGGFSITGTYTCPSADTQVFITGTGGNPGSGQNANLALMAALGPCGNLSSSTFININEMTTIGSVWPLAPFMNGPANIGASTTNLAGMNNAFADVTSLVDTSTGGAPGANVPAGMTLPVAEMNTLADILAACVNTNGGAAGSSTPCGTLFTAATPTGGSAPTDTITAAMNIAQHPGTNVAAIYSLLSPTAPFQPTLAAPPADFTIAATLANSTLSSPSSLAADASGNVWITNLAGNTLTKLSHSGSVLSGSGYIGSLNQPSSLAFAPDGTLWVTNLGNNTVSRFTSSGTAFAAQPYSGGGLNVPRSVAFDSLGNGWIANGGNASVTKISSSGGTLTNYLVGSGTISVAITPH